MSANHTHPDHAGVEALFNRAKQLVLTAAYLGNAQGLAFAQGSLNALRSVLHRGNGQLLAARDASMGGYQPMAGFEAAWSALPVGVERFSLSDVQELLRCHGVEVSGDSVSNLQIDAVGDFKDGKSSTVNFDDEHGATRTQRDNSPGQHVKPPAVESAIVTQAGFAQIELINWIAATLIALALSMAYLLDGPSAVQERLDAAQASVDAEVAAQAKARFAKAAQAMCGANAGWRALDDGLVQCLTKRAQTRVVQVVL